MSFAMLRLSRHFCTQTETPLKTTKQCIQSLSKETNHTELVQNFKKFSEIPRFRGRHSIYDKTILRLTSANKFPLIEELLEHQKTFPDIKKEGFAIRIITLYDKANMTEHAHKMFDEMPERDCPRTVKSLNALLNAYVHAKEYDEAVKLFRELPKSTGITVDERSYNVVILGLCQKGEFESAEEMLDEMEDNGLKASVFTYNVLMNGFYSDGRFEDGERVWGRMVKSGVEPDPVSFNGKIKGFLHGGEITKAVELFDELDNGELKPDVITYFILLRWYCNGGCLDEAKELYERMKKSECAPDRKIYQALIPCCCEKEELDFALELCKDCFEKKCYIDVAIWQTVINLLVKGSWVEEAKEVLELTSQVKYYCSRLKMPAAKE